MDKIIGVIKADVKGWNGNREFAMLFLIHIIVLAVLYNLYNFFFGDPATFVLSKSDFATSLVVAVVLTSYQIYKAKAARIKHRG